MPFETLWNQYPIDPLTSATEWIGGTCSNLDNQCAVRLSRSLKKYDTTNPSAIFNTDEYGSGKQKEPTCVEHKVVYARGAESLANYLYDYAKKDGAKFKKRMQYAPKEKGNTAALDEMRKKAKAGLKGKKGVIFFKDFFTRRGAMKPDGDHIDLWNGSKTRTPGAEKYFDRALEIWFYEFNEAADRKTPMAVPATAE